MKDEWTVVRDIDDDAAQIIKTNLQSNETTMWLYIFHTPNFTTQGLFTILDNLPNNDILRTVTIHPSRDQDGAVSGGIAPYTQDRTPNKTLHELTVTLHPSTIKRLSYNLKMFKNLQKLYIDSGSHEINCEHIKDVIDALQGHTIKVLRLHFVNFQGCYHYFDKLLELTHERLNIEGYKSNGEKEYQKFMSYAEGRCYVQKMLPKSELSSIKDKNETQYGIHGYR
jgi:hypothetical protein